MYLFLGLNFQLPSKRSPFEAPCLSRRCSLLQTVSEPIDLDASSASAVFVSIRPHQPNSSLWEFFQPGETKKSHTGQDQVNSEGGTLGHDVNKKRLNPHAVRASVLADKSPIVKWTNEWKEPSKKFTEAERSLSQQCHLVHWHRWVPRTLT